MDGLLEALPQASREWILAVGKDACVVAGRGTWGADEVARAALLVRGAASVSPEELYDRGDNRERQAVLRALPLLADGERFLPLAIEACRTNVLTIFEAIACENDYPQRLFPEPNWNQMVLKAAFNGVALARIVGLDARKNAELARMATDFAAERRAAGRPVPADLPGIMEPLKEPR